jgi:hypothetical protein
MLKIAYHKIFLYKNDKLWWINEHENTLYYEKYQTIDLVFFHDRHGIQLMYKKSHPHVLFIFLALAILQEIVIKCT